MLLLGCRFYDLFWAVYWDMAGKEWLCIWKGRAVSNKGEWSWTHRTLRMQRLGLYGYRDAHAAQTYFLFQASSEMGSQWRLTSIDPTPPLLWPPSFPTLSHAETLPTAPSALDRIPRSQTITDPQRTLASGLVIEDIKTGDGAGAKRGKRLGMRYIGKLTNGKQFDANTSGKPFSFVLGRGEVIKGWDEGLEGMKVGGERKLSVGPTIWDLGCGRYD